MLNISYSKNKGRRIIYGQLHPNLTKLIKSVFIVFQSECDKWSSTEESTSSLLTCTYNLMTAFLVYCQESRSILHMTCGFIEFVCGKLNEHCNLAVEQRKTLGKNIEIILPSKECTHEKLAQYLKAEGYNQNVCEAVINNCVTLRTLMDFNTCDNFDEIHLAPEQGRQIVRNIMHIPKIQDEVERLLYLCQEYLFECDDNLSRYFIDYGFVNIIQECFCPSKKQPITLSENLMLPLLCNFTSVGLNCQNTLLNSNSHILLFILQHFQQVHYF
eukprot:UN30552